MYNFKDIADLEERYLNAGEKTDEVPPLEEPTSGIDRSAILQDILRSSLANSRALMELLPPEKVEQFSEFKSALDDALGQLSGFEDPELDDTEDDTEDEEPGDGPEFADDFEEPEDVTGEPSDDDTDDLDTELDSEESPDDTETPDEDSEEDEDEDDKKKKKKKDDEDEDE